MGNVIPNPIDEVIHAIIPREAQAASQRESLQNLLREHGQDFPGSHYHPPDRKTWMAGLNPAAVNINKIVWPGTHNSATKGIGAPLTTRAVGQCQNLSVYELLVRGTRVLDIRVNEHRIVCHGSLDHYNVDVVIDDVRRFLRETNSEIIILEIRTEFERSDPPEFEKYLVDRLGDVLIHQGDHVFQTTVSQLLPRRVICVWKPRNSPQPRLGGPLWGSVHLRDQWIDTNLPRDKFDGNLRNLSEQQPASARSYFYRTEHTLTPSANNPLGLDVERLAEWMRGYARLFIRRCFQTGSGDKLQIFSTDYIQNDFVDACVGLTYARIHGQA